MDGFGECVACGKRADAAHDIESAQVPCNVRRFLGERFRVWRCPACRSIHASDTVDLDHYYAEYPFHRASMTPIQRLFYRVITRRLKRAGYSRSGRMIDYGCGRGLYIDFLRARGYEHVTGFDAYGTRYRDRSVLDTQYDIVFSQDVLEHVDDPSALFSEFDRLVRPGGLVVIGTPNASGIDLSHVDRHIHSLHQPYHRHILSREALLSLARSRGWELVRWYNTSYVNTLVPYVNVQSWLHYARLHDNTLDLAFDPFHLSWRLLTPQSLWLGFFGYFRCPDADIMAVFRAP